MGTFATEFPCSSEFGRSEFIAELVGWLSGMRDSAILNGATQQDLDKEHAELRAPNNETLVLRELSKGDILKAIGFRHELPDADGRLWRTEAVLRREDDGDRFLLRLRGQSIAIGPQAKLDVPKKPYIIKSIINANYCGKDGCLFVGDRPVWLSESGGDLELAASIVRGSATKFLPVVYISAIDKQYWAITREDIEKLAFDLGGVAHVVVENDRNFSFLLREIAEEKNAYGGTISISLPEIGIVRRFYIGWRIVSKSELLNEVRRSAITLRTEMGSQGGLDWAGFQDAHLQEFRRRERSRLSNEDIEILYEDEIRSKNQRIRELEHELQIKIDQEVRKDVGGPIDSSLIKKIGGEIYEGEFADRVRMAVQYCVDRAEIEGVDGRSLYMFEKFLNIYKKSTEIERLRDDIRKATSSGKKMQSDLSALLVRHGYVQSSDNKHVRMKPHPEFGGLDNITISKTPSDHRAAKNMRSQIEKALGITKLG